MARFALVALCVTASLAGAKAATPLHYGMTMATRAYEAVCWYETLKVFPETQSKQYGQCGGQSQGIQDQIDNPDEQNKAYMESDPDGAQKMYGNFMKDMNIMDPLPNSDHYKAACNQYLDNPKADPPSDESDALNDKFKKGYPYKAFASCMMKALRDKHGEEAITAVKNERTQARKHWMSTLLDRENEFRARHGSQPLALVEDLNKAAQEWADTNAKECKMYHSKGDMRKWNGESTGESLSAGGVDEDSIAAYQAADGWYEEIRDYPYPDGYQGGDDDLFKKIGHFTQSVWRGSQYVGYGYAHNPDCGGGYKSYIAARYFPAGNMEGKYPENVKPPK